jgi:hypothetical protein
MLASGGWRRTLEPNQRQRVAHFFSTRANTAAESIGYSADAAATNVPRSRRSMVNIITASPSHATSTSRVPSLGVLAALFGILLGASRSAFVLATLAATFALTSSAATRKVRVWCCVVLVCVAAVAATNGRMQRFTTLQDTDAVETRLAGSINSSFWEILVDNPMGNGLGGGGTSIPYFWESHVRRVVGLESEYSRILIEQTLFGLLLWLCFLGWVFLRRVAFVTTVWREGRRLAWFVCLVTFCQGMIGVGMFSSVPQSLLMFLWIGWFLSNPRPPHQTVPVLTTRLAKIITHNNTVAR